MRSFPSYVKKIIFPVNILPLVPLGAALVHAAFNFLIFAAALAVTGNLTPGIRRAFVVYLANSNRPIHEVLFPTLRDIRHDHEHNFQGMTAKPVPLDALLAARERMMRELQQKLDDNERRFLLPLVTGAPDWHVTKSGLWRFGWRRRGDAGETASRAMVAPDLA